MAEPAKSILQEMKPDFAGGKLLTKTALDGRLQTVGDEERAKEEAKTPNLAFVENERPQAVERRKDKGGDGRDHAVWEVRFKVKAPGAEKRQGRAGEEWMPRYFDKAPAGTHALKSQAKKWWTSVDVTDTKALEKLGPDDETVPQALERIEKVRAKVIKDRQPSLTKALASATYSITFDGGAKDDPKEHEWVNCTMTIDPGVQKKFKLWLLKPSAPTELTDRVNKDNVEEFLDRMVSGGVFKGITRARFLDPEDKVSWNYKVKGRLLGRQHVKNAVRRIAPESHEWFPVGKIGALIEAADGVAALERLSDFQSLVKFLVESGSPTKHVVFKPTDAQWQKIAAELARAAKKGDSAKIYGKALMAGHVGAIKLGGQSPSRVSGSDGFHKLLNAEVQKVLDEGGEAKVLKERLLEIAKDTVWDGVTMPDVEQKDADKAVVDFLETVTFTQWAATQKDAFKAIKAKLGELPVK